MSRNLTPETKQKIAELTSAGKTYHTVSEKLGVSLATVSRYKKKKRKGVKIGKALVVATPVSVPPHDYQEGMVLLRQARNVGGSLKSRSFLLCMLALNSFEGGEP